VDIPDALNQAADPAGRRLRQIPVVALTAHAMEEERVAALAAGFDAVITKPCLPPDLLQAVLRAIGPAAQ
jgi:CheY-like chemotaxis protein